MKLGMAEMLEAASKINGRKEKIEYLRKHYNQGVGLLIKMAFDKNLKWALPEGAPPFKESQIDDSEGILYNEMRRLYIFHEGGHPGLTKSRREHLFQQLLETLDKNDAKLLIAVKDKKIPYKGMTQKLFEEAYPALFV